MKNEYEIRGDVTAIIINSPKYGVLEAMISTDKLELVNSFIGRWWVTWDKCSKTFYVKGHLPKIDGKHEKVRLHRYVTKAPDGMYVDHKNNNGLINTNDNLRIVTQAENRQNLRSAQANSKSGVRGVSWYKQSNKWHAQIRLNKKTIHLGYFDDIAEAEKAVKEARAEKMPYSKEAVQ